MNSNEDIFFFFSEFLPKPNSIVSLLLADVVQRHRREKCNATVQVYYTAAGDLRRNRIMLDLEDLPWLPHIVTIIRAARQLYYIESHGH